MPSLKSSVAERLRADLADPDPDVRIGAVLALGTEPAGQPSDRLTEVVLQDPDPDVVAAAIGVLARLVGAHCEQALCQARDRFPGNSAITHAVTRALTALDRQRR